MKSYIHLYKTIQEFTEAYNSPNYEEPWLSLTEENNAINYSKTPPKVLTAITFENLTWVTDIPVTGGTATKDNCSYTIMARYIGSEPEDITSQVTVKGRLIVAETTATTRQSVGTLTLTAEYKGVTCTGSVAAYQEAVDPSMSPLTFKISSDGTINWIATDSSASKTIEYKLNNGEWASITSNTAGVEIGVSTGAKIQFRGDNAAYCNGNPESYSTFGSSTAEFEIEGNIMSLINSTNFITAATLESGFTFAGLFNGCTGLTSAENLILPVTTLADGCYSGMFAGCTSLTTAPALPVTTLADGCYSGMFAGCTSLATAPELPVTTLADGCYSGMFAGCTSLTTAPALPATALAEGCYQSMFYGCTSLKTAPELPSTILANYCYQYMFNECTSLTTAPFILPATKLAQNCYRGMFANCTSLTTAPELPSTTLANSCYKEMFYVCTSLATAPALPAAVLENSCYDSMFGYCTSLTTAPALPAITLADSCYLNMFNGCSKLNYIKCLATDISAGWCTINWVKGVASTGTFVKAPNMSGWNRGENDIPSGWAVKDAS